MYTFPRILLLRKHNKVFIKHKNITGWTMTWFLKLKCLEFAFFKPLKNEKEACAL